MTINSPLPGTARKGFFFGGAGLAPVCWRLSSGREKTMNRTVVALAAAAGLCNAAGAEVNTRIDVLGSLDGINYAHEIPFPAPGQTVQVLISVSYIGTASPLG